MKELWKYAFITSGLSAVGAFVFWNLYKNWLKLPIFSKVNSDQTFILMLVFLVSTFLALTFILITYIITKIKSRNERRQAHLELVDLVLTDDRLPCMLEFKVRNNSDEVVFLKKIKIKNINRWDINLNMYLAAVPISASYDLVIPSDKDSEVSYNISQEVKPNAVDRFLIKFHSDFNSIDFIGLFIYLLDIELVYNENDKALKAPGVLLHIPQAIRCTVAVENPFTYSLLNKNKMLANDILNSISENTIKNPNLLEEIINWAGTDTTPVAAWIFPEGGSEKKDYSIKIIAPTVNYICRLILDKSEIMDVIKSNNASNSRESKQEIVVVSFPKNLFEENQEIYTKLINNIGKETKYLPMTSNVLMDTLKYFTDREVDCSNYQAFYIVNNNGEQIKGTR